MAKSLFSYVVRILMVALFLHGASALAEEKPAVKAANRAWEEARSVAGNAFDDSEEGRKLQAAKKDAEARYEAARDAKAADADALESKYTKASQAWALSYSHFVATDPDVIAAYAELLRAGDKAPPLEEALRSPAPGSESARRRAKEDALLVLNKRVEEKRKELEAAKTGKIDPALASEPGHPTDITGGSYRFPDEATKKDEVELQQMLVKQTEDDIRKANEGGFQPKAAGSRK